MDYKNWKILKTELEEKQEEYSKVAEWCNENNKYCIEDDGEYYKVIEIPPTPEPTLEEKVLRLESEYRMNRWQREGILAKGSKYSDYTKAKAQEIEDLAKELR